MLLFLGNSKFIRKIFLSTVSGTRKMSESTKLSLIFSTFLDFFRFTQGNSFLLFYLFTLMDINALLPRLTIQLHAVDGIIIIICHFSIII